LNESSRIEEIEKPEPEQDLIVIIVLMDRHHRVHEGNHKSHLSQKVVHLVRVAEKGPENGGSEHSSSQSDTADRDERKKQDHPWSIEKRKMRTKKRDKKVNKKNGTCSIHFASAVMVMGRSHESRMGIIAR
jgi:hypothetical protein